ncbi:Glycosyl phosphatidyl inositol protein transamidase complex subunit [Arachnomyces sp. PD_36]|nr:Glycosyl phosphatidyl inositol protein transamidase complex subunit [Arachnomyces sp. PD_36]
MALISTLIQKLRRDPRLLFKLPPYISLLCIIVGVVCLLLLPLDDYSRQTYISENALLPGQVHTYFGGSEQHIFRAYKQEIDAVKDEDYGVISEKLQSIFRESGLKVATQGYEYHSAGTTHAGENVYSVIHAPRGDATEAIVLVAALKTVNDELNINGVALALTLARYFKRWSLWSKDIIFLITPDSQSGAQAWIDAYHDMHPSSVQPLPLKSGALQGAIVIEYPFDHRFESLHIIYDGVNAQLPNLDLINTATSVASGQMGIGVNLQRMWRHDDSYKMRLETMLNGMVGQGLGLASGLHSSFIPYHIDAITMQPVGAGWQDEMALGRTVESLVRSLNNLLEHLHQSFFFYLLMQANRFVSIGTYLPSAMLIAGNFTVMAMALWMKTGYSSRSPESSSNGAQETVSDKGHDKDKQKVETESSSNGSEASVAIERQLALPLTFITGLHFLGVVPLYAFNHISEQHLNSAALIFTLINTFLPIIFAAITRFWFPPRPQQYLLIKSFSLLLLGLFLSTLATLNFSLSFFIGLLCAPLSFVGHMGSPTTPTVTQGQKTRVTTAIASVLLVLINLVSPPVVFLGACHLSNIPVEAALTRAVFAWDVWGMWTQVVVWCVWWPAWLCGSFLLASSII